MNARDVVCRFMLAAFAATAASPALSDSDRDRGRDPDYRWRNVEIVGGGYVPGIIFNQTEPGLAYARTDIGGAYRWNERTQRWKPLLDWVHWDDWGLTGVDSLATDPVDPDRLYVLAGTYTNDWDPNNGAILRSKDRGRSFDKVELPFKSGGNMPGRNMGERLAIDPNANRILYLGARSGNGLWRSTDFGRTWARVASFPATGDYAANPGDPNGLDSDPLGVVWIVFDKNTGKRGTATRTIYVGVADLGQSVYRSQDGGVTWAALPGQPTFPAFMPHHAVLASTGILYITYNNRGGPYDGDMGDVWKYDTASALWTKISPDPSRGRTPVRLRRNHRRCAESEHPHGVRAQPLVARGQYLAQHRCWRNLDFDVDLRAMAHARVSLHPRHQRVAVAHLQSDTLVARARAAPGLDDRRHRN